MLKPNVPTDASSRHHREHPQIIANIVRSRAATMRPVRNRASLIGYLFREHFTLPGPLRSGNVAGTGSAGGMLPTVEHAGSRSHDCVKAHSRATPPGVLKRHAPAEDVGASLEQSLWGSLPYYLVERNSPSESRAHFATTAKQLRTLQASLLRGSCHF